MFSALLLALSVSGQQLQPQEPLPPPDSPPIVRVIEIAFPRQGNRSIVEPESYLYYIHTRSSRPSAGVWVPYDEQTALDDFRRLWATNFLDDLWIEVDDEPYANGVIGKHITFNLEERPRVKIVDFSGAALERSKIDDALKEANATIRADAFLDDAIVHKTARLLRDMLQENGYQYGKVTHTMKPIGDDPKLVRLDFILDSGPQVRIKSINFTGNRTFSDGDLAGRMKANKAAQWYLPSFLRRKGVYQPAKYESDADLVLQFCRDRGYVTAHVGDASLKPLGDSPNGRTRWVELRVPITEGKRYRVGDFTVEGNTVVKSEALRSLFKLRRGDYYREKAIRKGLDKAREVYGAGGYFEFTGYPELTPRDQQGQPDGGSGAGAESRRPRKKAVIDVTLRVQEGKQYFVNRLTFQGNTVTKDNVIRREMALLEGGVFNTEALKYSVKRLNQLGYFKPLDGDKSISVEKAPGADNKVDVTLKFEEQNRNQVQFGAGMSEYDGLYASFSYTAANFLGQGESVSLALQRGSRSSVYQVGISEPYLFNRPIGAGVEVYSRKNDYLLATGGVAYSEVREGASFTIGRPVKRFSRVSLNYAYEVIDSAASEDLLAGSGDTSGMPLFNAYSDLGRHVDSHATPSFSYNTVDNPMTPHSGMRLTGSSQLAGGMLGGSYRYFRPEGEAILYLPTSRRTGFGLRGQIGWLRTYGRRTTLPYYLRYYLGGEYQIRGYDLRTVGPLDAKNRALGGNKYVLFNAEYYFDIAGPVRALLFHDAGQAFVEGDPLNLLRLRTSTGAEVRVVVPMLNVPFRLIWAWNIYRDAFQPPRTFKFGVGATF